MSKDRIKVKQLKEWLSKYSDESSVTFLANGKGPRGEGTAYELYDITERPISQAYPDASGDTLIFLNLK